MCSTLTLKPARMVINIYRIAYVFNPLTGPSKGSSMDDSVLGSS